MDLSLRNKIALVTGASDGIGKGILEMLAASDAQVIGCGRSPAENLTLPEGAAYYQCDITSAVQITELAKKIGRDFGKLDILVSNAGANVFKGASGCTEEDWAHNLDLNLSSHWRVSKAVLPLLKKGEQPVIQIMSSNHAYKTIKGCFPYNVTKTALVGLVRSMALDLAPDVRVIGLAPGFIETKGGEKWFNSFPDPQAERSKTVELHPVKALGTVEQVGALAVFLSSAYASFITGETIVMDGGRTAVLQESI